MQKNTGNDGSAPPVNSNSPAIGKLPAADAQKTSETPSPKKTWFKRIGTLLFLFAVIATFVRESDDVVALRAVERYMEENKTLPRIVKYHFTSEGNGMAMIMVKDSMKNAHTGSWLGWAYYSAEVQFTGGRWKKGKVTKFSEISPQEDKAWKITSLGEQEASEAADQLFKR